VAAAQSVDDGESTCALSFFCPVTRDLSPHRSNASRRRLSPFSSSEGALAFSDMPHGSPPSALSPVKRRLVLFREAEALSVA
jgi:hypothetical protein